MSKLTHFNPDGRPTMVDVSDKPVTTRLATATGAIITDPATLSAVRDGTKKGDVIGIATTAAIMGAKKTSDLIPLCHPLPITAVQVDMSVDEDLPGIRVRATARTDGKTGVEMEALTAVSTGCLTLYDMLKAIDKSMRITDITITEKRGGQSDWA